VSFESEEKRIQVKSPLDSGARLSKVNIYHKKTFW